MAVNLALGVISDAADNLTSSSGESGVAMNTAICACEHIEAHGYTGVSRDATIAFGCGASKEHREGYA